MDALFQMFHTKNNNRFCIFFVFLELIGLWFVISVCHKETGGKNLMSSLSALLSAECRWRYR